MAILVSLHVLNVELPPFPMFIERQLMKVLPSAVACAVMLGLLAAGCSKEQQPPKGQAPPSLTQGTGSESTPTSAGGVHWTVPSRWGQHPPRQMRIATYMIQPAEGDTEGGECAVFHFGSGQGGDVQSNINRWLGQFEDAGKPDQSTRQVNGLPVTLVSVSGTYLAPGGPMMQSQGKKQNFRLLGAIIEAPEGAVFFKMTGPAKTIGAAEKEFDALVASVEKL
jgi:hypothetical protein